MTNTMPQHIFTLSIKTTVADGSCYLRYEDDALTHGCTEYDQTGREHVQERCFHLGQHVGEWHAKQTHNYNVIDAGAWNKRA